jgi:hypothetical protein
MSRQTYPVVCECGVTHPVAAGAAGSSFPCGCGKTVAVPSLVRLKASVGESGLSADFEIEGLLARGDLPLEPNCVLCDCATRDQLVVAVQCEREREKESVPVWARVAIFLMFGWVAGLLVVLRGDSGTRTIGRNLLYHLPVRVCQDCVLSVRSSASVREALRRTELYARLLEKYPHARVSPPN